MTRAILDASFVQLPGQGHMVSAKALLSVLTGFLASRVRLESGAWGLHSGDAVAPTSTHSSFQPGTTPV